MPGIHTEYENGYMVSHAVGPHVKDIELALLKFAKEPITRDNTSLLQYCWLKLSGKKKYYVDRFVCVKEMNGTVPSPQKLQAQGDDGYLVWFHLTFDERQEIYSWAKNLPNAVETFGQIKGAVGS